MSEHFYNSETLSCHIIKVTSFKQDIYTFTYTDDLSVLDIIHDCYEDKFFEKQCKPDQWIWGQPGFENLDKAIKVLIWLEGFVLAEKLKGK